jgi:Holliday junction resolvase RusA-like endonuclease
MTEEAAVSTAAGNGFAHRLAVQSLLHGPFRGLDKHVVVTFTLPGKPVSKARARWDRRRGRMYTPEETLVREQDIRAQARTAHRELIVDTVSLFSLRAGFYLESNQRRDADNLLKLVSDALTGVVWADDSQVVEVFGFKVPADRPEEARTEVAVLRMPGAMPYSYERCLICQRQFRTYPSWRFRRCCSRRCWGLSMRRRVQVTCAGCGNAMERTESEARSARLLFCSLACRRRPLEMVCPGCHKSFTLPQATAKKRRTCSAACASLIATRDRRSRRLYGACARCGVGLTKSSYRHCKGCQMARTAERTQGTPA